MVIDVSNHFKTKTTWDSLRIDISHAMNVLLYSRAA